MSALPSTQLLFQDERRLQRGSSRPCAASWSGDEYAFAERMIAWWKVCSKNGHTPCASKTRRNRFVAIQLYRWLNSADNEDPKMTEDDVKIAIESYSKSDYNSRKCEGRYQSFGDWMRGCPDNVDKELKRISRKRGNNLVKEKAAEVVRFGQWGDAAGWATKRERRLFLFIKGWTQQVRGKTTTGLNNLDLGRHLELHEWLENRWSVLQDIQSLTEVEMSNLMSRADVHFAAYAGRAHSMESLADRNLRGAMACSLLEKYKEQVIVALPTEKGRE